MLNSSELLAINPNFKDLEFSHPPVGNDWPIPVRIWKKSANTWRV